MEHQARFALLREGELVKDTNPQDDYRPPHGAGIIYAAIAGAVVYGIIIWLAV